MSRCIKKWLSLVLCVTVLLTALPMTVFAGTSVGDAEAATETESEAANSAEEPYVLYEIEEKRELDTKHFMMSDGSILACIYSQAVHYEKNGVFEDIDNTLEEVTTEDGVKAYRNKENSFGVEFPEDVAEGFVKYSDDNGYVMFRMVGVSNKKLQKKQKSVSDKNDKTEVQNVISGIKYKSAKNNIDIEYDITGDSLKETVVINKKTKESFVFEVKTSAADVIKNDDGSVEFYDQNGNSLYVMQSPYMEDAAGAFSEDISVTLEKTDEGYLLAYTPSYEWLKDKAREYPVRLDPTVTTKLYDSTKVYDTYTFSTQQTGTNLKGSSAHLIVGKRSSQLTMRGFIKFELPDEIGKNDTIVDAKLHLVQNHGYTSNSGFKVELLELAESFDEATVSWPTQPSAIETVIDYTTVGTGNTVTYSDGATEYTQPYDTFNVTRLVSKWHSGATNNGVMLRLHNESETLTENKQVYYFSRNSTYFKHVSKFLEITYRNTVGLEDYWSYSTRELPGAGVGYVNNYNGNLVFTHNDAVNNTGNTAFTITHVYNSALVRDGYVNNSSTVTADEYYGNGWRLNIQQTFKPYVAADGTETNIKFVYTDGDGTEHYFVQLSDGSIVDEDGLGLTYTDVTDTVGVECKVTDKSGNVMVFDTNDDLTEIIDANGNSIDIRFANIEGMDEYYITSVVTSSGETFTLSYNEYYQLTSVTDNAGRVTSFAVDGGDDNDGDAYDRMCVTYPDGTKTVFEFDGSDLLSRVTAPSGMSLEFQYNSSDAKVQTAALYGSEGTQSSVLDFDYDYNQTKVTYQTDRFYVYQFDTFGRVTGIYDENNNICSQSFTATSTSGSAIFSNNKLASVSNTSAYVNNLVDNGCFYNEYDGWNRFYSNDNYSIVTDKTYVSPYSVKVTGYATEPVVLAAYPEVEAGKTYTLSAYLKLENVVGQHGAGVEIVTSTGRCPITKMTGTTDESINGGFKRFTTTITLSEGETISRVTIGLYYSTGTLYVNGIQLEEGETANMVNFVSNSSFEQNSGNGTVPTGYISGLSGSAQGGCDTADALDGTYSCRFSGGADEFRSVMQSFVISGNAGDVYSFGGWAKADAIPSDNYNTEDGNFKICVRIHYADGTYGWANKRFNEFVTDWQYVMKTFVTEKAYTQLDMYCSFDFNCNTAYFDNIYLYRDTVQSYTYDSNGNVVSAVDNASQESTYRYNDNNLSKLISPTGQSFTYNYDGKHNLVYSSSSNGVGYSVTYDSFGNPVSAETVKSSHGSKVESGKVYYIKNRNSGKCLTITDSAMPDMTAVVQSSYTGSDMQKFRAVLTEEGYYILQHFGSDTALLSYYSRYEENTKVEMYHVAENNFTVDWSHWTIALDDVAEGCYNIIARPAEKGAYMTVTDKSTADNAQIRLGYEDNSTAQQWYFVEVPEAGTSYATQVKPIVSGEEYYIRNAGSGQYLSVKPEPQNDTSATQHTLGGCAVQKWSVNKLSNGYFIIRPEDHSDMALTFLNRNEVNSDINVYTTGTGVDTIDWSHWALEPVNDGSGAFRVRAVVSTTDTKYMGVEGSTNAVGGNVRFEALAEDEYQKWYFVKRDDKMSSSSVYTSDGAYLQSVTDSRGNTTTYDYDETKGLLDSVTDAEGNTVEYTYNASNDRLLTVKSGDSTVTYTYTTDGKLNSITTASNTLYSFAYDEFGRSTVIKVGSETLSSTEYVDNLRSLVKKQTYGNGAYRTYDYDAQDRVTAEYVNGTAIAKYVYDKLSRVYKYTDVAANVSYTYEYDLIGRVLSISASDGRAIGYSYDTFNRTKELKQSVAGVSLNNKYHYNAGDGSIKAVSLNGSKKLSYTYDGFGRQNIRKLYTTTPFITEYTFLEGADGNTTTLVKSVKNGSETLQYAYDKIGNITSISKNGTTIESYTYDSLNQLKTVTRGTDVYEYTYDNGGNILNVKLNGEVTKSYTYGDTNWKDKLTAYNGQSITYDAIGNPLTYRDGYTFTWANGRQLSTVTNGTNSYSYTYNADGLRTSKTVNGTKTEYYWMGSVLQGRKTGSEYILYLHDENGNTYGFLLKNGTTQEYYYYIFNAQGDVIGILNSAGTKVVSYEYSAWGEVLSVTGTLASTIGAQNPIRYRGYYYDNETGFYYLQSRYYDPTTQRFLNADGYASTGQGFSGLNMFAYCGNNPINRRDFSGMFWEEFWEIFVKKAQESTGFYTVAVGVSQVDSIAPGPGDVVAGILILGGLFVYAVSSAYDTIALQAPSWSPSKSVPKTEENDKDAVAPPPISYSTYYHVTTLENAKSIMTSSTMKGATYEAGYVYAWRKKPSKYAIMNSGAHFGVVISFETAVPFVKDTGIDNFIVQLYSPVVSTVPGPIHVSNVKIVG